MENVREKLRQLEEQCQIHPDSDGEGGDTQQLDEESVGLSDGDDPIYDPSTAVEDADDRLGHPDDDTSSYTFSNSHNSATTVDDKNSDEPAKAKRPERARTPTSDDSAPKCAKSLPTPMERDLVSRHSSAIQIFHHLNNMNNVLPGRDPTRIQNEFKTNMNRDLANASLLASVMDLLQLGACSCSPNW